MVVVGPEGKSVVSETQDTRGTPSGMHRLLLEPTEDVISLDDPRAAALTRSGGKGANLARLRQAGLPVPDGFVIATEAFRQFVQTANLGAAISRITADLDVEDADAVATASSTLRTAFEASPVPAPLAEHITSAWRRLGEPPVAVRSSATAEDLPDASFAGQQDTLLDVTGTEELMAAVRRCWSSLWTARALSYRTRQGIGHTEVSAAVVVQRMLSVDVAGVLFTADPMTGQRRHMVVEAVAGLGDALVGGRVTPQRWLLDAPTRVVLAAPDPGSERLLDRRSIGRLIDLGVRAAGLFDAPQDIEWATSDEVCWILQSRPITSLFPVPSLSGEVHGLRVYMPLTLVAQGMTEPLTPAGSAFFVALAKRASAYWSVRGREQPQPTWAPVVLGRIFYDITPLLAPRRMADRLSVRMQLKDPAAGAALREWLENNADRLPRASRVALPLGLTVWLLRQVPGFLAATAAPHRARRRLIRHADTDLAILEGEAARRTTPAEQVEFTFERLPSRGSDLVLAQLPPVYVGLLASPLAEWLTERWLGSSEGLEPVRRWLPHDPTLAMGTRLAELAEGYAATGVEPSASSTGIADFLAAYGHRAPDREIDLGLPRFADDPTYVVELIRSCLRAGDPAALLTRQRHGATQAASAVDQLVTAVCVARGPVRARLLRIVMIRLRELGGLRERPKFDLVCVFALGRRLLQQVGASLVSQKRLDDPDDVFFLEPADLRDGAGQEALDLRQRAADNRRRYERELSRRVIPRILTSEGEAVYGPTAAASPPGTLVGIGVSPGVHEGVVRVLDSPLGADLHAGEVLVAATTDPGWTPLFLLAGALVMEVGGVLSHGAVVAREYGIPAVATVPDATRRLRTGQRVRVDGGAGLVTVLDPESSSDQRARER